MQNDLSSYPAYLGAPPPIPMNMPLAAPAAPAKNPNPDGIEIRTKFPVARIKRIMQADEEVGKVAQVTPVAVSKALELFMISLVQGAARVAREKGGKRVTAQCLKRVVEADEQFDFLSEIVGRVQDVQEDKGDKGQDGQGKGRRKRGTEGVKDEAGSETEEEGEEKKKRKGKGRRKKSEE
jgi:histone H3/H4